MPSSQHSKLPFEPNLESAEAWMETLPVGNSRECCRLLYAALQGLNAADLDPVVRCRILERMRPMADLESGKLLAGFVGKPLPLDERLRKSAKLSAQFQAELARGYQTVVGDERAASVLPVDEWVRYVRLALSAYEQYLLRLALMYEAASPGLWSRVHALYSLAERCGFAGRNGTGIGEIFGRMLAFRLACPNRFDQEDAQRLYTLLHQHGSLIELKRELRAGEVVAEFEVNLDAGTAPVPVAGQQPPRDDQRFLYTGRFLRQLSLQMESTVPEQERLDEAFAYRVMVRLGGSPPYSEERKGRQATIVLGLDSILAVVAKAESLSSTGNAWTGLGDLELVPLSDHMGAIPPVESSKSAGTFGVASSVRKPSRGAEGELWLWSEREYPCQVQRAEIPGFYWLDTGTSVLQPGKLVALNTDNTLVQVGLAGAARPWGGGGMFVFELLANQVTRVQVSGSSVSAPYVGLFAQSEEATKATLLGPPVKLRNGDVLELEKHGRRHSFRIARLLESTSEFTQFELVSANVGIAEE